MHISRLIYLPCSRRGSDMHLPLDLLSWPLQVVVICLNSPTTYRSTASLQYSNQLPRFYRLSTTTGSYQTRDMGSEGIAETNDNMDEQLQPHLVPTIVTSAPLLGPHNWPPTPTSFTVLGWLKRKCLAVYFSHDCAGLSPQSCRVLLYYLLIGLFSLARAKECFLP